MVTHLATMVTLFPTSTRAVRVKTPLRVPIRGAAHTTLVSVSKPLMLLLLLPSVLRTKGGTHTPSYPTAIAH